MVTGAYAPEISGGSLQCRALVRALRDRVSFMVLTTSTDSSLPRRDDVDGVPVCRIHLDVRRRWSKLKASVQMSWLFLRLRRRFDIVHLHGYSQKAVLLLILAKVWRKPFVLKLTSAGYDDPLSIRKRSAPGFWCYRHADLLIGVSPRLEALHRAAGLSPKKFALIPNGVDLERFHPRTPTERRAVREELGLTPELTWTLFVGFFSHEKCPEVLFEAWMRLHRDGWPGTGLLFVGATRGPYHEVDPALSRDIQEQAKRLHLAERVVFVEATQEVEKYYAAAALFVLPSVREGLPNVLLEAMASGLPCVATELSGITDAVIEDGVNGLLIPPRDVGALEQALRGLLQERSRAQALGRQARHTVEERYALRRTADRYLDIYHAFDAC